MNQEIALELANVTIGIITALPCELAAVRAIFGPEREVMIGDGLRYYLCQVPSRGGGNHYLALALLPDVGNNSAAVRATRMIDHCQNLKQIVMVGIAGAVPHPSQSSEHVRLGDIVVSNEAGVIQWDLKKISSQLEELRNRPRPPSPILLQSVRTLQAEQLLEKRPWESHIERALSILGLPWQRPGPMLDRLYDSDDPSKPIEHPVDGPGIRQIGQPRIFCGPIGSANTLLADPKKRDELRNTFRFKAIEMEGSGVADATWSRSIDYLVVRGTCDYCDSHKNDIWHNYAALAAAAFTRSLIEATGSTQSAVRTVNGGLNIIRPVPRPATGGEPLVTHVRIIEISETRSPGSSPTIEPMIRDMLGKPLHGATHDSSFRRADSDSPFNATDLVAQLSEQLCCSTEDHIDAYDFDAAFETARQLEDCLTQNDNILNSDIRRRAYALLARIEVLKLQVRHNPQTTDPAIEQIKHRARAFIRQARNEHT